MPKKFCVSVGVRRCGKLPELPGAVNGAKQFATWAKENEYNVVLITDDTAGKVRAAQITSAVAEIVNRGDADRLIIYFAGHGSLGYASAECWLLSDAATDGNEAINVGLSLLLAAKSQIGQIGLIADACRSRVANADEIGGQSMFPRREEVRRQAPQTDKFFACSFGAESQEVRTDELKAYGIFSKCLMDALRGDVRDAVKYVTEPEPAFVVTSDRLANYLEAAVVEESGRTPGASRQDPEIATGWRSPNDVYRVLATGVQLPPTREAYDAHPWTSETTYAETAGSKFLGVRHAAINRKLQDEAARLFDKALPRMAVEEGLIIRGARPVTAVSAAGSEIAAFGDHAWHIRARDRRAQTILVKLEDGRWLGSCLVADYLGEVEIGPSGAKNLLYRPVFEPVPTSPVGSLGAVESWTRYLTAAIHMRQQPPPRPLKDAQAAFFAGSRPNPSLAILIAFFLTKIGRADDVDAIASSFLDHGGAVPFDVALLAGAHFGRDGQNVTAQLRRHDSDSVLTVQVDGHFPLLTRTWGFLAAAGDSILREVRQAAAGIEQHSLWTLFSPDLGTRLADYIEGAR
jgi:uncharacterized caspase-like protein